MIISISYKNCEVNYVGINIDKLRMNSKCSQQLTFLTILQTLLLLLAVQTSIRNNILLAMVLYSLCLTNIGKYYT
jgi:hypothetical protein